MSAPTGVVYYGACKKTISYNVLAENSRCFAWGWKGKSCRPGILVRAVQVVQKISRSHGGFYVFDRSVFGTPLRVRPMGEWSLISALENTREPSFRRLCPKWLRLQEFCRFFAGRGMPFIELGPRNSSDGQRRRGAYYNFFPQVPSPPLFTLFSDVPFQSYGYAYQEPMTCHDG